MIWRYLAALILSAAAFAGSAAHAFDQNHLNRLLSEKRCPGCDLSNARIVDEDMRDAYLPGANLSGADLTVTNFSGANLAGANLDGADLSMAVLTGTILDGASLKKATVDDADFGGASVSGIDVTGTKMNHAMNPPDLSQARAK